jgi:integrase
LLQYEKFAGTKLHLSDLNSAFLKKFYNFLVYDKENPMQNNTAHKYIQLLKSFIIFLNDNLEQYRIKTKITHKFKYEFKQNKVIYLTEDELMRLYNLEVENERLKRVRDVFCFQCFTGVRYSDLENLKRVDIQGSIWNLFVKKTKQILEIPLSGYAQSILAKYKEFETPLPIISNQKFNVYVKELCELAGIDEPIKKVSYQGNEVIEKVYKKFELIGSHTARRTFISLSLMKGMSADVIMSITGHSDYKMMKRYLEISNKHKKDQMYKAWSPPLALVK